MKTNHQILVFCIQALLILSVVIAPCFIFSYIQKDLTFLLTSVLFAFPLVFFLMLIKNRFAKILLFSIALVLSLIEVALVVDFGSFIVAGNILSIVATTPEESASFIKNNRGMLFWYIPIIICYAIILRLWKVGPHDTKISFYCLITSFVLAFAFIIYLNQ